MSRQFGHPLLEEDQLCSSVVSTQISKFEDAVRAALISARPWPMFVLAYGSSNYGLGVTNWLGVGHAVTGSREPSTLNSLSGDPNVGK